MGIKQRDTFYPDKSGFEYDSAPVNVIVEGLNGKPTKGAPNIYELADILFKIEPNKYNSWTNWIDKIQPDYRFLAISDANAETYLFPNVDDPWMFTEYIFEGKDDDKVIEPPLYDSDTLKQINSVESKKINECGWQLKSSSSTSSSSSCINNFPTDSDGVILYKTQVNVQCVKWGEHGNIPPHTLNMTAPRSWIKPENLLTTKIVPKFIMKTGSPVYATVPGVLKINSNYGDMEIKEGVTYNFNGYNPPNNNSSSSSNNGVGSWNAQYTYDTDFPEGTGIKQPKPSIFRIEGSRSLEQGKLLYIGSEFSSGDVIHGGCEFWEAKGGIAKCRLSTELQPPEVYDLYIDPNLCSCGKVRTEDTSSCQGNPHCPYYKRKEIPIAIGTFESQAASPSEFAKQWAGIENYDEAGGTANLMNGASAFDASFSPIGGGSLFYGGLSMGGNSVFSGLHPVPGGNGMELISSPRKVGEYDMRWDVKFEIIQVPAEGKETYYLYGRSASSQKADKYLRVKRGTGKLALDLSENAPYKGVDSVFFGDINQINYHRWMTSVMHCQDVRYCNSMYGVAMQAGYKAGEKAGGNGFCRYYVDWTESEVGGGCPFNSVPKRAYEYQQKYYNASKNLYPIIENLAKNVKEIDNKKPIFLNLWFEPGNSWYIGKGPNVSQAKWYYTKISEANPEALTNAKFEVIDRGYSPAPNVVYNKTNKTIEITNSPIVDINGIYEIEAGYNKAAVFRKWISNNSSSSSSYSSISLSSSSSYSSSSLSSNSISSSSLSSSSCNFEKHLKITYKIVFVAREYVNNNDKLHWVFDRYDLLDEEELTFSSSSSSYSSSSTVTDEWIFREVPGTAYAEKIIVKEIYCYNGEEYLRRLPIPPSDKPDEMFGYGKATQILRDSSIWYNGNKWIVGSGDRTIELFYFDNNDKDFNSVNINNFPDSKSHMEVIDNSELRIEIHQEIIRQGDTIGREYIIIKNSVYPKLNGRLEKRGYYNDTDIFKSLGLVEQQPMIWFENDYWYIGTQDKKLKIYSLVTNGVTNKKDLSEVLKRNNYIAIKCSDLFSGGNINLVFVEVDGEEILLITNSFYTQFNGNYFVQDLQLNEANFYLKDKSHVFWFEEYNILDTNSNDSNPFEDINTIKFLSTDNPTKKIYNLLASTDVSNQYGGINCKQKVGDNYLVAKFTVKQKAIPTCSNPNGHNFPSDSEFCTYCGVSKIPKTELDKAYIFIDVYDLEGNELNNSPWFVELTKDYKVVKNFAIVIDNEEKFLGGHKPEYKDISKRGEEILMEIGAGDGLQGDSGVGDPSTHTRERGYIFGYWTDKSGEWIIDGRSLHLEVGEYQQGQHNGIPEEQRITNKPSIINGATPIHGIPGVTIMNPTTGMSKKNTIRAANIYSCDTHDFLQSSVMQNLVNEEGDNCKPQYSGKEALPSERYGWYDVDNDITLHEDFYEKPSSSSSSSNEESLLSPWGGKLVYQKLRQFPITNAIGKVSVWGLPGMVVKGDAFFWKSPTFVNIIHLRQMRFKLGEEREDKSKQGGWSLKDAGIKYDSNITKQEIGKGYYKMLEGKPVLKSDGHKYEENTDDRVDIEGWKGISDEEWTKYFAYNKMITENAFNDFEGLVDTNIDDSLINERYITPYSDDAGLKFVSIREIKALRNLIEPTMAYLIGKEMGSNDFYRKKAKYDDRYYAKYEKEWKLKPGRIPPQVLAATNGRQQQGFIQYWDGQFPGTCVREYTPPGVEYWRLHNIIGGISRNNGVSRYHMDADDNNQFVGLTEFGYHGDKLVSSAMFFLYGYLPMDKEIIKAYALIDDWGEPDFPSPGVVWSGRRIYTHYHPWTTGHESAGRHLSSQYGGTFDHLGKENYLIDMEHLSDEGELYPKYQRRIPQIKMLANTCGEQWKTTIEYNHAEMLTRLSNYDDSNNHGREDVWNYLTWDGFGTDIKQLITEYEIWKHYTFDEFQNLIDIYSVDCEFFCEDFNNRTSYRFRKFADIMLQEILPEQMQPISALIDFNGLNTAKKYNRKIDIAKKEYDDSWHHGGQIIVQSNNIQVSSPIAQDFQILSTNSNENINTNTVVGVLNAGNERRVLDVTEQVKNLYNNRIDRYYVAFGGKTYEEVRDKELPISQWTGVTNETDELRKDRIHWNHRYRLSGYGYCLTDKSHFPQLENDSLPLRDDGDKIKINEEGRIQEVTIYSDDYHPLKLFGATNLFDGGGNQIPDGGKPKADGKWYFETIYDGDQYFTVDLYNTPFEKERRDWRIRKPTVDCSQVICPNPSCRIHRRGMTVAEWLQFMQSGAIYGPLPSFNSTRCCSCGADLSHEPGFIVKDGDNVNSYFYEKEFEKIAFITKIIVDPIGDDVILNAYKCGYKIQYMQPVSKIWITLIDVGYDKDNGKYYWYENGIYKEAVNPPTEFDVSDKRIRTRYIRYVVSPLQSYIVLEGSNGTIDKKKYTIDISDTYSEDWFVGATLETGETQGNYTNSYSVLSSSDNDLFLDKEVGVNEKFWRLTYVEYRAGCAKLEVYGFNYTSDELTITTPPLVDSFRFITKEVELVNWPTQILNVYVGNSMNCISLKEVENINQLTWKTKELEINGIKYRIIESGTYYYDYMYNKIYFAETDQDGRNIFRLNMELDPSKFNKRLMPTMVVVEYWIGAGSSVDLLCEAEEEGPSYQVEKEAICEIVSHNLPNIGNSVKLPDIQKNWKRREVEWLVYNHEPMYGKFEVDYLTGLELGGDWSYNAWTKVFGQKGEKINGKVTGTVTIYGKPDTIISGNLRLKAPAYKIRDFVASDGSVVTTYERTGGFGGLGLLIGVELEDVDKSKMQRKTLAWKIPTVIVFARERSSTEEI